MLTIEGIYKNGQVVLTELPEEIKETRVLVTFLQPQEINLSERGINQQQAAELRGKLSAIADDWNAPEMDVYDVD